MRNLVKYSENENDIIYTINNEGLVSIPKELKDNVKVFMTFKNGITDENKNQLMMEMQEISKTINQGNNDGLFIVSLIDTNILQQENIFTYANELDKIKKLVNAIYNKILGEGNLTKENFIKKVGILNFSEKYNNFINWLCLQEPNKFYIANYQQLKRPNLENTQSNVFINQNAANIFNEPNRQSSMMAMQSNINPINESLSINTPNRIPETNGQYIGQNPQTFYNQKKLVKTLPNNNHKSAAFIKWYTTLFILIMSMVIGIGFSIYLVN